MDGAPSYSFTAARRQTKSALADQLATLYGPWIGEMVQEKVEVSGVDELVDQLKDGILLCRLANAVQPGSIKRFKTTKSPFNAAENVNSFLRACADMGIKNLFRPNDLITEGDFLKIVATLEDLRLVAESRNVSPASGIPLINDVRKRLGGSDASSRPVSIVGRVDDIFSAPTSRPPPAKYTVTRAPPRRMVVPAEEEATASPPLAAKAEPPAAEVVPAQAEPPKAEPPKKSEEAVAQKEEPVKKAEEVVAQKGEPVKKEEEPPVQPEPVKPVEPAEPAPVEPAPVEPAPVDVPVEPAPIAAAQEEPVDAAPVEEAAPTASSEAQAETTEAKAGAEAEEAAANPLDEADARAPADIHKEARASVASATGDSMWLPLEYKEEEEEEDVPVVLPNISTSDVAVVAEDKPASKPLTEEERQELFRLRAEVSVLSETRDAFASQLEQAQREAAQLKASNSSGPAVPPRPDFTRDAVKLLEEETSPDFSGSGSSTRVEHGTRAITAHEYVPVEADELPLRRDTVVKILQAPQSGGWWYGEAAGRRGWFPQAYVVIYSDRMRTAISSKDSQSALSPTAATAIALAGATGVRRRSSSKRGPMTVDSVAVASAPMTQLMWRDTIDQAILDNLSEREKKRQEAIFELMRTEREYVRDLEIIMTVFQKPLAAKKIVTEKELQALFSNVETLHKVNQALLEMLEKRRSNDNPIVAEIGSEFKRIVEFLKVYTMYCSNHPAAMATYMAVKKGKNAKAFARFEEEAFKNPTCRMLDLNSFLVKPVQRICKYPLLLREIMKHTPNDSEEYSSLESSLRAIETVVTSVNEYTRQMENSKIVVDIQKRFADKVELYVSPPAAPRTFIAEETITAVEPAELGRKKPEPRTLILFDDLVVVCKQSEKFADKLELVHRLAINEVLTRLLSPEEAGNAEGAFALSQKPRSFVLWNNRALANLICFARDKAAAEAFLAKISNAASSHVPEITTTPGGATPSSPSLASLEELTSGAPGSPRVPVLSAPPAPLASTSSSGSSSSLSAPASSSSPSLSASSSSLSSTGAPVDEYPADLSDVSLPTIEVREPRDVVLPRDLGLPTPLEPVKTVQIPEMVKKGTMAARVRRFATSVSFLYACRVTREDGAEHDVYKAFEDFVDLHMQVVRRAPQQASQAGGRVRQPPAIPHQLPLFDEETVKRALIDMNVYVQRLIRFNALVGGPATDAISAFFADDTRVDGPATLRRNLAASAASPAATEAPSAIASAPPPSSSAERRKRFDELLESDETRRITLETSGPRV